MARGRFISNVIIEDREIHELSSDTCRLAYVFLITLADREGRITGELDYLTSKLFPRRREITTEIVKGFINEWADAGFVVWYEDENNKKAIQLVNFEKHQKGLRKDREPESEFGEPENGRLIAGTFPESCGSDENEPVKEDKELKEESLISNINVNVKPAKNAVKKPAKSRQKAGVNSSNIKELEDYFIELTKLVRPSEDLQPKQAIGWENALTVWGQLGATKDDIRVAVDESDENNMTLVTTDSITSFIKSEIARRERGVTGKKKNESVDEMMERLRKEEAERQNGEIIDG